MLGTTVPDAILIGGLIASVLAGLFGKKEGDKAKAVVPPDPVTSGVAAGFVDKDLMLRLTMATESIAESCTRLVGIQSNEHDRAIVDRFDRLEAALLKKHDDDDRAARNR